MYSVINEEIEADDDDDDDEDGVDNNEDGDDEEVDESTLKQKKINAIVKSCKKVYLKTYFFFKNSFYF